MTVLNTHTHTHVLRTHTHTHAHTCKPTNNKRLQRNPSNANHVPLSNLFHFLSLSLFLCLSFRLCSHISSSCQVNFMQKSETFHRTLDLNYAAAHVCRESKYCTWSKCHMEGKMINECEKIHQKKRWLELWACCFCFMVSAMFHVLICGQKHNKMQLAV